MNINRKIILQTLAMVVLLAAFDSSAQAKVHVKSYVRPIAQYTTLVAQDSNQGERVSTDSQFSWGFGVGAVFGERERFELGVEISSVQFEGRYWVGYNAANRTNLYDQADYQVMPLLVTFRYYFRDKDAAIRPYLGAFWGIYDLETTKGGDSESGIGFSAGIGGGLSIKLRESISIDVGYRYIDSTEAIEGTSVFGVSASAFCYKAHIFAVGVNVRL